MLQQPIHRHEMSTYNVPTTHSSSRNEHLQRYNKPFIVTIRALAESQYQQNFKLIVGSVRVYKSSKQSKAADSSTCQTLLSFHEPLAD